MTHGKDLTEYTSFELQVLLDAIASRIVELKGVETLLNRKSIEDQIDVLDQWSTKIIEAKAEVRMSEINTTEN